MWILKSLSLAGPVELSVVTTLQLSSYSSGGWGLLSSSSRSATSNSGSFGNGIELHQRGR
jgi:hypothetical protein